MNYGAVTEASPTKENGTGTLGTAKEKHILLPDSSNLMGTFTKDIKVEQEASIGMTEHFIIREVGNKI